jgi:hypothetical protein
MAGRRRRRPRLSFAGDLVVIFRRGCLRRAHPRGCAGELPVQAPVKYEPAINRGTARARPERPPPPLARAEQMIEQFRAAAVLAAGRRRKAAWPRVAPCVEMAWWFQ